MSSPAQRGRGAKTGSLSRVCPPGNRGWNERKALGSALPRGLVWLGFFLARICRIPGPAGILGHSKLILKCPNEGQKRGLGSWGGVWSPQTDPRLQLGGPCSAGGQDPMPESPKATGCVPKRIRGGVSHPSVLPEGVWIALGAVGTSQKFFLFMDLLW